jgi:hypothetical protein
MSSRFQVYFIAALLIIMGVGMSLYKANEMGFPLINGQTKEVWTIESLVKFKAKPDESVKVSLTLPAEQPGVLLLDEQYTSNGYGLNTQISDDVRKVIWTKRQASGTQRLYYKLQLAFDSEQLENQYPDPNPNPESDFDQDELVAANVILDKVFAASADTASLVNQLITEFNAPTLPETTFLISGNLTNDHIGKADEYDQHKAHIIKNILALKGVDAAIVRGVALEDQRRRLPPKELLAVYAEGDWKLYSTDSDDEYDQENFLIWQIGGVSLLDVEGGENSSVRFSMIKNIVAAKDVAVWASQNPNSDNIDFSIYSLPIEHQSVFKLLLLIPLGALVVVFLRVLVGLKTSGTFMPVLIALSFIETTLSTGLPVFLTIVVIGLLIRSYLSNINLLLVARVAAIVVIVVGLMSLISIVSFKLGIEQGLTVTFFPMIILAWTIERMSIIWEEEGPKDVLQQGSGSLIVAIVCYFVMTTPAIQHLAFNFPELHLASLGLILILGQYNGYRLSELLRFAQISKSADDWQSVTEKKQGES